MSILLQVIAILIGLAMIIVVLNTIKMRKLNEAQSIFWLVGAVGIVVLGIFPQILSWFAEILGIWWKPAVLLCFLIILLLFITFNHTREISVLVNELTELSIQLALLRHANEKLTEQLTQMGKTGANEGKNENTDLQ